MALVLGRRAGESIKIGDDIVVTITEIDKKWGHVRIAIDAPREVNIVRSEIAHREREENFNV
jgi:carbon storage regulator